MNEDTAKEKIVRGSCFCNQIKFELIGNLPNLYQCHCSECRKTTGSSANAGLLLPEGQFSWISGEENINVFTKDSGYRVNFCRHCGSPVPNLTSIKPNFMWIPAGLLENLPVSIKVSNHICVSSKASWDIIAGSAKQYATLPDTINELL